MALVCGETDKHERERHIADFRAGWLRCLVTVLALATGFDVPDGFVRISLGIEDTDDVLADFEQALG